MEFPIASILVALALDARWDPVRGFDEIQFSSLERAFDNLFSIKFWFDAYQSMRNYLMVTNIAIKTFGGLFILRQKTLKENNLNQMRPALSRRLELVRKMHTRKSVIIGR